MEFFDYSCFLLALLLFMCYALGMARVKYMKIANGKRIGLIGSQFPSFHHTGSVRGMKNRFYGKKALLVHCGAYIYNVTEMPSIYISAY